MTYYLTERKLWGLYFNAYECYCRGSLSQVCAPFPTLETWCFHKTAEDTTGFLLLRDCSHKPDE